MSQIGTCTLTGFAQRMQAMFAPETPDQESISCTLSDMVSNEPERGVQMTTDTGQIITFHMPSRSASERSEVLTYPSLIVATPREPGAHSIYAINAQHSSIRQSVDYFEMVLSSDRTDQSSENNACVILNSPPSGAQPALPARTLPCDPIHSYCPHPLIIILQRCLHVHACIMYPESLALDIIAHACAHSLPLSNALLNTVNTLQSSIASYQSEPSLAELVLSPFPELCIGWNKLTFTIWNKTQTSVVPSGAYSRRSVRGMQREYAAIYAELFNGALPDPLCLPTTTPSSDSSDDDDDDWKRERHRDRTFSTGSGKYDIPSTGAQDDIAHRTFR